MQCSTREKKFKKKFTHTMINGLNFKNIFKGKKLMQWLKSLLYPKDSGFEIFHELFFSSINEMDKKIPEI